MSKTLRTRTAQGFHTKGAPLSHGELDDTLIDLSRQFGWVDYNDLATQSSPVAIPQSPTFVGLPNDGAGPFTNKGYLLEGHGEIWDAASGQFDFSSLKLGDTLDFRLDLSVTTGTPNQSVETILEMAIGTAAPYSLSLDERSYKTAGEHQIVRHSSIYMGDNNTLSGGARFAISSDAVGATLKVNGWFVKTNVWGG